MIIKVYHLPRKIGNWPTSLAIFAVQTISTMYRSHTCGELRAAHIGQTVTLAGWVQRSRELGGMTFLDLRDRYGITQVAFNEEWDADLLKEARKLGREWVVQIEGEVIERHSKNANMPTGDVEIKSAKLVVLNAANTPPFTIEEESDGGEAHPPKGRGEGEGWEGKGF